MTELSWGNINRGMLYNCTVLKDLPECPAGTRFKMQPFRWNVKDNFTYTYQFPGDKEASSQNARISRSVVDNPTWVRKEIDESCLTELKCEACGGTRMLLNVVPAPVPRRYRHDTYYYRDRLVGECPCGHTNEIVEFTSFIKNTY